MNEVEFLEYVVKSIVWKWGNTINSIRTIVRIFWLKIDKKINIKVLD